MFRVYDYPLGRFSTKLAIGKNIAPTIPQITTAIMAINIGSINPMSPAILLLKLFL